MKIVVSDIGEIEEILHDCIVDFDDIQFIESSSMALIPVQVITNESVSDDKGSIIQRLFWCFKNRTTSGMLKVMGATGVELLGDDGIGRFMINRIERGDQSLVISGGFPGKLYVYGRETNAILEYEVERT